MQKQQKAQVTTAPFVDTVMTLFMNSFFSCNTHKQRLLL
jgi:hypothetical protein